MPLPCDPDLRARVHDHLPRLLAMMSKARLAYEAGISIDPLHRLARGGNISVAVANAILAVPVPIRSLRADRVDTAEVRAHLRRLTTYLWQAEIEQITGVAKAQIHRLMSRRPPATIARGQADAILAVPVPTVMGKRQGTRRPVTNPKSRRVDDVKVALALDGRLRWAALSNAEKTAAIIRLIDRERLSDGGIAARLGVSGADPRETVCQHRRRAGITAANPTIRKAEMTKLQGAEHGTHQGYKLHLAKREKPCEECKAGERTYRAELQAANAPAGTGAGITVGNTPAPPFLLDPRRACGKLSDTEALATFFPEDGDGKPAWSGAALRKARETCAACPLVVACWEYSIPISNLGGIWGGLTPGQRERIRADRLATAAKKATGTPKAVVLQIDTRRAHRSGLQARIADMGTPVRCGTCSQVYDLDTATVMVQDADATLWRTPCCNTVADTRRAHRIAKAA